MTERDLDRELDALLDDAPMHPVPDAFAQNVLAAAQRPRRRRWRDFITPKNAPWAFFSGGLAAAAAAIIVFTAPTAWPATHTVRGESRIALGAGAVMATTDAAEASVDVPVLGASTVTLAAGGARFLTPSRPLVVHAADNTFTAANAAFTLELPAMNTTHSPRAALKGTPLGSLAFATLAGAAIGAVVTLAVFDGEVSVASADGATTRTVTAGESVAFTGRTAQAIAADTCDPEQTKVLTTQVTTLEAQLKALMMHDAGQSGPLVKENARLAAELAQAQRDLNNSDALQRENEGRAFDFPEDLPDSYREDALRAVFTAKLKQSGLDGELTAIDCTEFPCIVYGDAAMQGDTRGALDKAFRELNEMIVSEYPREQNKFSTSVWGDVDELPDGTKVQKNAFGFAIYPQDSVAQDAQKDFARRMRYRNQQYADTLLEQ